MSTIAQMVQYGTAASMPSASIPGRVFYTSDTEQIFRDNGTTWDNVTPTINAATIKAIQNQTYLYGTDTGTANVYTVALSVAPTLAAGTTVFFKALNANTGASTLALNGGPAKSITKQGTTPLAGGEIVAGQIVLVTYDGTEFQIIGGVGSGGGSGPTLQTNGTNNASQALLNLIAGTNVTLTNSGGGVTINASGGGGGASPFLVQYQIANADTAAFGGPVNSGNLLVVVFASESTVTGGTVTDTLGTTYSLKASLTGNAKNLAVYAGLATSSGANTVTVAGMGGSFDNIALLEVYNATVTVDVSATYYNSPGTSPSVVSATTTQADFVVVAAAGIHSGNSFVYRGAVPLVAQFSGSDAISFGVAYLPYAGEVGNTILVSGGADNQPNILVAFK